MSWFKTKKKQKDFNNEVNLAICAELERFGSASAEHFASFAELKNMSSWKINPEHSENNFFQQAGKAAEVKNAARRNAENIINGNPERIARTDTLGETNHRQFDHVTVDSNGTPILNSKGHFLQGSQQKSHSQIKTYRNLFGKEYEHYKDAILDVPSDQLDGIVKDWNEQIQKLEEQKLNRINNGDFERAKQLDNKIKKINDAKSRLRDSKVSTADALEARKQHIKSVAKDVAKVSHKAGVESAKMGAAIGGGISSIQNIKAYWDNDKNASEALLSVAKDTGKAATTSYLTGASSAAVGGVLKNSSKQICKNLAKKNGPAAIVQSGVILAKHTTQLLSGKITPAQFAENINQEGMTLAASMTGGNLGAVAGTMIMPGVGTIIGGVIGGMVASMMSGALFNELKSSINATKLSSQRREQIHAMCNFLIEQEIQYRENMLKVFDEFFTEKENEIRRGFDSISEALLTGNSISNGLGTIGDAFNLELQFKSVKEFEEHIQSGNTLQI